MSTLRIDIEPSGAVRYVADGRAAFLRALGPVRSRRVSDVLPARWLARLAFRLLRLACGDTGRVAAYTRTWRGPWRVRMRLGCRPYLGQFNLRADALRAERRWLRKNLGL